MRRALALLMLVGCGTAPAGDAFDLELVVQRGLLDEISAFQVALVTNVSSVQGGDCTVIRQSCIRDQVAAERFVPLKNPQSGRTQSALVFPIALTAGVPSTQDVSLTEVPPGRDYGLIIEAISKDGMRLTAAECQYVPQLNAGTNQRMFMRLQKFSTPRGCDPRIVR